MLSVQGYRGYFGKRMLEVLPGNYQLVPFKILFTFQLRLSKNL